MVSMIELDYNQFCEKKGNLFLLRIECSVFLIFCPIGHHVLHIFASLAEFERDIIRERTHAGLSSARARGRKGGRPKGVNGKKRKAAITLKKYPERSLKEICDILDISRCIGKTKFS